MESFPTSIMRFCLHCPVHIVKTDSQDFPDLKEIHSQESHKVILIFNCLCYSLSFFSYILFLVRAIQFSTWGNNRSDSGKVITFIACMTFTPNLSNDFLELDNLFWFSINHKCRQLFSQWLSIQAGQPATHFMCLYFSPMIWILCHW